MAGYPFPMHPQNEPGRVPAASILKTFLVLGSLSFGGGTATMALIRGEVVDRKGWVDETEFTRDWSLCQMAPGINLLSLASLIGWRLCGIAGLVTALGGLLLPSATLTVALTAVYATYRESPLVEAALRGVLPATVALGAVTAVQMARPLLAAGRSEGLASLSLAVVIMLGATALSVVHVAVPVILLSAAALGAIGHWRLQDRSSEGMD